MQFKTNKMNELKITPVNYAMQAGLFLGILGIVKFLLLVYSIDYAAIGLIYLLAALFFHFVVFYKARRFKNDVFDGQISFFQAWNVSILMYFFGAILSGAIEFAYYKFLNPGFLSHYIPKSIAAVQQISAQVTDSTAKSLLTEMAANISLGGVPSAIDMVFAHIQNTVFSGIFVSLIISATLVRTKKTPNNHPNQPTTDNTL